MSKIKEKTAVWTYMPDPIYFTECPHCKKTILMSRQRTISRLIAWAKHFKG